VRAVVDVNVLISAALSARGPSAEILRNSRDGAFELVVSELLIAVPHARARVPQAPQTDPARESCRLHQLGRDHGRLAEDPPDPAPVRSPDPDDDYLLALAISGRAFLVTGDQHLLGLREDLPILTPAEFVTKLRENG
jgi:uncharacterized protein